ncbi:MAG: phage tail sheath family protein [Lachnospiraceae bacterium]|nr:phage tail sheath family protein [Lachnospiraceae bacterium]
MSGYKHGAYGSISDSVISAANSSQSVPFVVGTAPVNLIRGYANANIINSPVYITDMGAKNVIGYSEDWDKFTLCEMLSALFDNANGNIGPAFFVNVLDPAVHKKSAQTTKSLTFTNGSASITSDTIILDTFALAGKTEGTDYNLDYSFNTGKVLITSVDNDTPLTGTIQASYYEVDTTGITEDTIIGSVSAEGVYTGLQCGKLVYPNYDAIITYIAAPKWSERKAVYDAMVNFCQAINDHWYAMPYADIPVEGVVNVSEAAVSDHEVVIGDAKAILSSVVVYETGTSTVMKEGTDYTAEKTASGVTITLLSGGSYYAADKVDVEYKSTVDTLALAKDWQTNKGYNSMYTKVFWPQAKTANGKVYHLSTLALAETLRVDASHDGIPMETCSNKSVPVAAQYFGAESKNQGFDQSQGNTLNAVGITTLVKWGGSWRLWGPHTAAFEAGADGNAKPDVNPLGIFDTNMRMQEYIINSFEADHGDDVDEPMDRNLKDTIVEVEQQKLDSLVAQGALIGEPVITFVESENTIGDLINGNFTWNIVDTPTPAAKSLTAKVAYTDAGFTSYFGEEE